MVSAIAECDIRTAKPAIANALVNLCMMFSGFYCCRSRRCVEIFQRRRGMKTFSLGLNQKANLLSAALYRRFEDRIALFAKQDGDSFNGNLTREGRALSHLGITAGSCIDIAILAKR